MSGTRDHHKDDATGILYAGLAYVAWGVVPLYWRLLAGINAVELTMHRIFWCALLLLGVIAARGHLSRLISMLENRRLLAMLALTSVLISINWTIFIYSVATHRLLQASLGYYVTPLISIALGILFFGERISRWRMAAIALAGTAVAVKTIEVGVFPWIALSLAVSFGLYGYFRKLTAVSAIDGLCIETWILFPVTAAFLAWWGMRGEGAFPAPSLWMNILLVASGPITAVPLVLFAAGVRRIRMTTLGFLQYFSPSITLLIAVAVFGEDFTRVDALAFGCVWAALAIVAGEGPLSRARRRQPPPAPAQ